MVASNTNASPRERSELVGNRRGQGQGKNFLGNSCITTVLCGIYLVLTSAVFLLCRKIAKPSPLL